MIVIIVLIFALVVTMASTFGKFARSDGWHAPVTRLSSITGFVAVVFSTPAEG